MFCRILLWILYCSCLKIDVESAICGNLTFTHDNVTIGGTTDLVFTSSVRKQAPRRVWYRIHPVTLQLVEVYRSDTDAPLANVNEVPSRVRGDITLQISAVSNEIIGKYMLRFYNGPYSVCDSRYATLNVKPESVSVVPDTIIVQVPTLIKENETQTIVCTTFKGRPPVEPKFLINAIPINSSKERNIITTGDTYTVNASIRTTFTRRDNQGTIKCGLDTNYFKSYYEEKTIHVLFPPLSANLAEVRKPNFANGDSNLELRLAVAASNPRSEVKWEGIENGFATYTKRYLNDSETKGQSLSVDVSMNLTRADNNRKVIAIITNQMFPEMALSALYVINITYAPVVTIDEGIDTKTVFGGDDVRLSCNVDSNPLSTVSWYNENGVIKKASGKPPMSTGSSAPTIIYLVGGIVAVVCAAALIGVLVFYLIRKRRTNEGQNIPQNEVDDRNPSAQPIMNEPVCDNVDKTKKNVTNEQQIYATVIPKDQRPVSGKEDKQVHTSHGYRNEDGLLYADLEIHHDILAHTNKPVTKTEEATQYVTVDFSKTGILDIHDIPDEDGPSE